MAYLKIDEFIYTSNTRPKNEGKRSSSYHPPALSYIPDNLIKSPISGETSYSLDIAPDVTAVSWAIYDPVDKQVLASKSLNLKREIASITKIMTCILILEIAEENSISLKDTITITPIAARMPGTTANLEEGDRIRIKDLLYGLMLPSGNDAAISLSNFFGSLFNPNVPSLEFIRMMNSMAKYMELDSTFYQNAHGLSTKPNISTVKDVCVLAAYAMKNKIFRKIVNAQSYSCEIDNEY